MFFIGYINASVLFLFPYRSPFFFLSFLFSEFLIFVTHGQGYKVTVTFSTNIQVFGDCHDLPGELFFNFISQTTLLRLEPF